MIFMVKEFRSVRISDNLIKTCEEFLKTKKADKLGILTLKDSIEYFTRKGMELEWKKKKSK